MMARVIRALLYIVVFLPLAGHGQLFFSNLSTRDGLPSNIISAVAQDNYDFIWIGTGNGLARYDGYSVKTFKRMEHLQSLPANEISSLLVDGDFLWVGTWRGLCKINTRNFSITRIDLKENNVIRTLYKDTAGNIWIGTATGLLRFQQADQSLKHYTVETHQLSHNTIRSIYMDHRNDLWVGTYDKLNKLNKQTDLFTSFDLKQNYKPELKNNLIQDIKPVAENDSLIWVGTETGLCRFNIHTNQFTTYRGQQAGFSNEVIKNIYTDAAGRLWLGTDFGLNIFDPKTRTTTTHFHNPQISYSIANNVIWEIKEDAGGVVWIVTSNGLSKLNVSNHAFTYHEVTHTIENQTSGNQVKSLLITRTNVLWIATLHGVIRHDLATNKRKLFDTDSPAAERLLFNNVFTLEEDDLGRIWIGTAGGINVWDEKTQRMFAITANTTNGLTSNYIARFTKGADGSFWVSAWEGGLFKIVSGFDNLDAIHFEFVGDFASEKNTYALQALWGLQNNELYRIDLNTYITKKITTFNTLTKGRDIYNLYYAPKGSLWSGTNNGLIEYKPNLDSALYHPIITGNDIDFTTIISDQSGNIWAAADQFVLKFSPANSTIQLFPLDKELPLKTFYNNCAVRNSNGDLLFGGDNGYISFQPNIKPNAYEPHVFLTSLEVNNKTVTPFQENGNNTLQDDISFTDAITLDYAQRSITIGFASLHYWQPEINVYAYKLEGLDVDWKYVSGLKNFAVYTNLSPGTYTLHVKGTNNYGTWSNNVAALKIIIQPPLFLSTGFIFLYVVLAISALIAGMRIYAVRLKLKNKLNIALLEKEHAEEIVQTKQQFFTSISHELRTPISLIIPPIQQIIKRNNLNEEDRTLITLAEKNSQRLLRLINQILDFRKLEHENQSLKISWFDLVPFCQDLYSLFTDKAARNEIDFSFNAVVTSCTLWADKEKVEIIIFNLLSNAFKFTPKKGKISFYIDIDNSLPYPHGAAKLTIIDTGIGIAEDEQQRVFEQFYQSTDGKKFEDGSGIGLTLVTEYTRQHHGEVRLSSTKGIGSTFSVYMPLGSDHFPVGATDTTQEVDIVVKKGAENAFNLRSGKPLILLVEDNHDMIDFISITLKDKYNFIVAENGQDALQKAHNLLPEIIVSDIMMPLMDGIELCKRIKLDNRTSHIPIILLTAKSLTVHKIEGIRVGADAYITKPFEIELLEAHIDHLMERKAELAQFFRHELITEPQGEEGKGNEDEKFLKKVMNSIEANVSNPDFSVEQLSDEMGMSSTHLYRKLKSLTHISASEIIKKYRIKKASLLLKNKEGNISEIMYDVGFSNLSYFSKCFKTEFGLTPKEYQQKESKHSFDVKYEAEGRLD